MPPMSLVIEFGPVSTTGILQCQVTLTFSNVPADIPIKVITKFMIAQEYTVIFNGAGTATTSIIMGDFVKSVATTNAVTGVQSRWK